MSDRQRKLAMLLALVGLLAIGSILMASPADQLNVSWWTVDGGGGTSGNGSVQLDGTIGQPDAGRAAGGTFSLKSGFWGAGRPEDPGTRVYLPVVLKPA